MPGFTIASILGDGNTSTRKTDNLKRKTSHDDEDYDDDHQHHHQPNKRQTIEGNNQSFSFLLLLSRCIFAYRIKLN